MPADENPVRDLFVRFKQNIDHHFGFVVHTVAGLPSHDLHHMKSTGASPDVDDGLRSSSWPDDHQGHAATRRAGDGPAFDETWPMIRWYTWLSYSTISPWNLNYMTPPRPNDLPSDMDESPNGWADAFEDLLIANSSAVGGPNQPLADHHERLRAAKHDRVAHGSLDRRALWLAGLRVKGLLGAAYPFGSSIGKQLLQPLDARSAAWSGKVDGPDPRIKIVHDIRRTLENPLYRYYYDPTWAVKWPAGPSLGPVNWAELGHKAFGSYPYNDRVSEATPELPQTEEDELLRVVGKVGGLLQTLFQVAGSDLDSSRSPRSAPQAEVDLPRTPGKHTATQEFPNPDGTTTIVTREETVDDNGNLRSFKKLTRTVDADGNEISRSTESKKSWSWGGKYSFSTDDQDFDGEAMDEKKSRDGSKKGFGFWK